MSSSIAWGHKMTFRDLISLSLMSYCMTTFIFQGNACICIERQNLCWKICLTTIYRSSNLLLTIHISIPDMIATAWYTLHYDKSCSWVLNNETMLYLSWIIILHFVVLMYFRKCVQLTQSNLHTSLYTEVCKEVII